MITLNDFKKIEIRIGRVVSAEKVANTDRLLKLIFNVGEEERQIVSAIAEFFPDISTLVGKEMPIIMNLEPKEIRGVMSHGMIVVADVEGKPVLLHPDKEIPPGSLVK